MLEPITALDTLPPRVCNVDLMSHIARMRRLTSLLRCEARTPRNVFEVALGALRSQSPIIDDRSLAYSPALWFRAADWTCTIVLNRARRLAYREAIFLLAHHVIELSAPTALNLCCPFDDGRWQIAPQYEQHRIIFVALMTSRLDATFRGIY